MDNDSANKTNDLVVVGSSAGGIGALSTLVSTINKNFPAPVVLAQHLDPQRPSQLGSILDRRSNLPVVIVDEQSPTLLEAGKIYVVPSNRHVKIRDGHVLLEGDHGGRPKPSVDLLLSTAAESYGEHLIAVILTGSGSDGAAGAVDVKNAGGVVIIQNPQTAAYPSMPLSLPPTVVDHIVEMDRIGPLLFDILKGVDLPSSEKVDDPLRDLLTQVSAQTNLDFRNYKSSTILRRIGRRMAATHNTIDRTYRIMTINAAARRLLGIHDVAHDQDFLHSVRGLPYQEVRRAIDTSFRERSTSTVPELELDQSTGTGRYIDLTIMIMHVEQGAPEVAVITATDITEQVQIKRRLEAVEREQSELVGELSAANKRFSAMNKELQDANEELQAANEELMLTQEELQATNEEFEATNEELQATNEELETNNEELQATNEELQTTNDELSARTMELQEVMKQYRLEQSQLSQLLGRFPYYVLIVNAEDLTVQQINPAYRQVLGGRDVIGLSVREVFSGNDLDELLKALKDAIREGQAVQTAAIHAAIAGTGDGNRMIHTAVPIPVESGGGVERIFLYSEKPE